ncbi:mediator of RNA polymerase II transcription subunit 19-like isoform X1 [Oratosquilla oratoria]|uniref:mediator of RNA polymerase II transcription subunit 19-like isoform X1 n=1 Tax=Oratosquilla oratoria TaxID=337810 RepID=UPI003F764B75
MNELARKVDPSFSPKSSPRGSRSPMANPMMRNDSTGTLKMTISAGKHPAVVHSGPFYLMKHLLNDGSSLHLVHCPGSEAMYTHEPASEHELTGAKNLMAHYGFEHSYNKFTGKKVRDSLSSFLPSLPGIIDTPAHLTNSSLRSLIEKPPVFKEFQPLSNLQLAGFRLHPGPLPEQYRFVNQPPQKKHKKHKKHKHRIGETPTQDGSGDRGELPDKKPKKKKKKEKKKKKQKHSPEHPGMSVGDQPKIKM